MRSNTLLRTKEIPFGVEIKKGYQEIKELHECINNSYPNEIPPFPDENKNQRATIVVQTKASLHKIFDKIRFIF